jgi:replicative DNA helicase
MSKQPLDVAKISPNAQDVEPYILGALMIDGDALEEVIVILKSEMFYVPKNQIIYSSIERLFHANQSVDILSITNDLIKTGQLKEVGGAFEISQLTNNISSSVNTVQHSYIVKEAYIRRECRRIGEELISKANDPTKDIFEIIDAHEEAFNGISEQTVVDTTQTIGVIMEKSVKDIESAMGQIGLTGVASGFPGLDALTHGFQKKKLYLLGARPAAGKSAAMLQMNESGWDISRAPSLIFSIEMDADQNGKRMLSSKTGISHTKISRSKIDAEELALLKDQAKKHFSVPIFMDDNGSININQLKAISRKYVRKMGVKIIWVDYLQKIKYPQYEKHREREVSEIVFALKSLAKSLDIPIVGLCMLGRSVEERKDKIPILNDLRETGNLEAEADAVIFIYRPSIHKIFEDAQGNDVSHLAKFIIAKHRSGGLGEVKLTFDADHSRFISEEVQQEIAIPF